MHGIEELLRLPRRQVGRDFNVTVPGLDLDGPIDPESDMDVLVVLDEPRTPERRNLVSHCAWEAGFDAGIVVTSVIFSREEWENGPEYYSPFAETVRWEGIPV